MRVLSTTCWKAIRSAAVLAAPLAVLTPAGAEIYRCTDGQTTVFSDVPCAGDAEVHRTEGRVSIVHAADNLGEIAQSNKAFLQQRHEALAEQRQRAARQQREARQRERRLEAIQQARRYRTVVGHLGNPGLGISGNIRSDPRTEARRRSEERTESPARRRTLLSRSGGNQRIIR